MKIIVLGYHNIGYTCLEELIEQKENVAAVFTHKDNPKEKIWFNSVEKLAKKHHIPVYTPENINDQDSLKIIKEIKPDIIFSFYYRNLISQEILDIPPMGCINLHGSLLPKYRGRCPVNWVILKGETETGVTLHYMEKKPDKGAIIAQKKVEILFEDTAFTLFNRLTRNARELFHETFPLIKEKKAPKIEQLQTEASYFGGRKPEDGKIDWNQNAVDIYNLVRAITYPYPGAFTFYKGEKLIVWNCRIIPGENNTTVPGTITKIIPDRGLVIATKKNSILLNMIQFENTKRNKSSIIAEKNNLTIGEILT